MNQPPEASTPLSHNFRQTGQSRHVVRRICKHQVKLSQRLVQERPNVCTHGVQIVASQLGGLGHGKSARLGRFFNRRTEAAPRLRHSSDTMPVPENKSRMCNPDKSTRDESKLNKPSRQNPWWAALEIPSIQESSCPANLHPLCACLHGLKKGPPRCVRRT